MGIENLKHHLIEWTRKRDEFLTQANLEVATYNGRIAQLNELITELENINENETETTNHNGVTDNLSTVYIPSTGD